jgi:hypothetical protein
MFYPPAFHGSIWEFRVSTNMTGAPDHVFLGQNGEVYGWNLWHVDLNGDGQQELVDGEPGWNYCGKVYVTINGTGQDSLFDATFYQGHFDASLGYSGCNAGDFNDDGIEDMAIGEIYPGYGRLHMILGDDGLHQSGVSPFPQPPLPQTAALLEAHPNPFNSSTVLSFELPHAGRVTLEVFDIMGRNVGARPASPEIAASQTRAGQALPLQNGWLPAGSHEIIFDGSSLPSGIYLARLAMSGSGATPTMVAKKLVLLR